MCIGIILCGLFNYVWVELGSCGKCDVMGIGVKGVLSWGVLIKAKATQAGY
jgi:hypothetical protein